MRPPHLRLLLVRHGEVLSNREMRYVGSRDEPLADSGVRQAEHLAKKVKPGAGSDTGRASARSAMRPVDADLAALERQLGDLLGLRVKVSHGKSGGTVALHYSSLDQLDLICQRLSGEPI